MGGFPDTVDVQLATSRDGISGSGPGDETRSCGWGRRMPVIPG